VLVQESAESPEMKISCTNEGNFFNAELLELLHVSTQESDPLLSFRQFRDPYPTELRCFTALQKLRASVQTIKNVDTFLCRVKKLSRPGFLQQKYTLSTSEYLNLVNLMPKSLVEVFLLMKHSEDRLAQNVLVDLLKTVKELS